MILYSFECDECGYSLPFGFGGYMYVTDADGKRICCPHPDERATVDFVLGRNASKELVRARTGFNSDCLCLDCMAKIEMDIKIDDRKCPECDSTNVKTAREMVGGICPKCGKGTIEQIDSGIMT